MLFELGIYNIISIYIFVTVYMKTKKWIWFLFDVWVCVCLFYLCMHIVWLMERWMETWNKFIKCAWPRINLLLFYCLHFDDFLLRLTFLLSLTFVCSTCLGRSLFIFASLSVLVLVARRKRTYICIFTLHISILDIHW